MYKFVHPVKCDGVYKFVHLPEQMNNTIAKTNRAMLLIQQTYTAKKEVEISHLTGGKITLYTISTMVDSRVFEFYTNLSV